MQKNRLIKWKNTWLQFDEKKYKIYTNFYGKWYMKSSIYLCFFSWNLPFPLLCLFFILVLNHVVKGIWFQHGSRNCLLWWGHSLGSRFVLHRLLVRCCILGTRRVCVLVCVWCMLVLGWSLRFSYQNCLSLLYYMSVLAKLILLFLFVVFRCLGGFVGCIRVGLFAVVWILVGFVLMWILVCLGCIFCLFCSFLFLVLG